MMTAISPGKYLIITLPAFLFLSGISGVAGQEGTDVSLDTSRIVSDFADDNERCFSCHAESMYRYTDESSALVVQKMMNRDRIIHREEYYRSNHKSFYCLDCHSEAHLKFPHPPEVLMHEYYTCLDCHGNVKHWADFHFGKIQDEYDRSVHNLADPGRFSCWKCHDPHTYYISRRKTETLLATIAYDNTICLSCHSGPDHSQPQAAPDSIDIFRKHAWLPGQVLHFKTIRCIECHTRISDSILFAHQVLPKENAVQQCYECHSKNSILMHTLFKFQSLQDRKEYGFLNAAILNHAYVIGANRNSTLEKISLIIFGLTFVGILLHIFFRVRQRNWK
jgi:hypothetical protein